MKRAPRIAIVAALCLGWAGAGLAQTRDPFAFPANASAIDPGAASAVDGPKSPTRAVLLSLAATIVPAAAGTTMINLGAIDEASGASGLVLIGLGLGFGPCVGQAYAGEGTRGLLHGLLRTGLLVGGAALFAASGQQWVDGDNPDSSGGGGALPLLGVAMMVAGGIYSIYGIVDSGLGARRTNARLQANRRWTTLTPLIARDVAGTTQVGLSLSGSF